MQFDHIKGQNMRDSANRFQAPEVIKVASHQTLS